MNTKALRQKILDLAIHGKLVPQDPNDEPASVLLERIKAEKERLVKEGKIKRTKRSKVACDKPHYPYELPKGWCWTTLGEIGTWQSGATPSRLRKDYYGGNIPWLKTGDLNDGFITDIPESITNVALQETSVKLNPKDSVLIAMYGATIGKVGILTYPATTNQACCACTEYIVDKLYLFYFLLAYRNAFIAMGGGGAQPNISKEKIITTLMPLPPLQEQKRIVDSIGHWFSLVNSVEESKDNLQEVIKQTKSKILDLAIHGKLVPQDPTDEPATELLKRIKPKAEFACDNPHYRNLPEGWAVTTLKDMCENINGLWKGKKEPFVNVGVIRNANFTKDFKLDYSKIEYIDVEQRAFNQRHLKNGDLIVEKSGGSDNNPVGRAILYEGKDAVFSFSNFTMALRIKEKKILTSRYLYYFLLAEYQKGSMRLMQTQTTGLHNLILDKYLSMSVLLPPFSEQLRITAKIEDLFGIMDAIKANL